MGNIHDPLTALLCFGTTPKIDSSNYAINSIWLSEQQAAQMCNFGRKHQRYLVAMQSKKERTTWARHSTFFPTITTPNTLIKWKSDFWTYTTKRVGRAG